MFKAMIILTLALGSVSLLAWLTAAGPAPQGVRHEPAAPGRVVGAISAPLALAAFGGEGRGGGDGAKKAEAAPDTAAGGAGNDAGKDAGKVAGKDAGRDADKSPPDSATVVTKTDAQWRALLGEEAYQVTRCSATEAPFTGKYWNKHDEGTYVCVACGQALFTSDTKFDSGSGWPSYFRPASPGAVTEIPDDTQGMRRIEVRCRRCGAHLGHVFPDGPRPTGLRYCINSAALDFRPKVPAAK